MAYVNQQFFGAVTADEIINNNLIIITGSITANSNTITNISALNTYDLNLLRVSQSVYSVSNGITSSAYITNINLGSSTITLSKTSSLTQGDTIGFSTPSGVYYFKSASFTDPNNLITVNDISGSNLGKDYAVLAQAQRGNSLITGRFHLYTISEVTHRSIVDSHLSFFVEWGEPYTEESSGDVIRLDGKNLAIVDLTDINSLSPEFSREIPGMENIPIGSDLAAWNIALNNYLEALETSFTPITDFNTFTSSYYVDSSSFNTRINNILIDTGSFDSNPIISTVATTTILPRTPVYNNGPSNDGINAFLSGSTNGVLGTIDSTTVIVGDTILVKNQAAQLQNGVYDIITTGSLTTQYVLRRSTLSDETIEFDPQIVIPAFGTTNKGGIFAQNTNNPVVGVSAIVYSQQTNTLVSQVTTGTQATYQIPWYTATARQLSKGSNNLKYINVLLGSTVTTSSLVLTGSMILTSGSYSGSGANLFNIPASGIVGLNLSQIASGSVSASITPESGLQINTNITATGNIVASNETALTLTYFSSSKELKSLPTATYPSLTEISYVKGLTSPVQTQLGTKQTVFTGTANYVPKSLTSTTLGVSRIKDDGSFLGIDSISPIALSKDIQLGRQANKEIGIEQSDSLTIGRDLLVTAGRTINYDESSLFLALNQGTGDWRGISSDSSGNIYTVQLGVPAVYKQTGGTGNFAIHSGGGLSGWIQSVCVAPNGNIYVVCGGNTPPRTGPIFVQTGGIGTFTDTLEAQRQYMDVASTATNNIYTVVYGGDIYMQTAGTGAFNALSQTSRAWTSVACAPNGNVYATVASGDIYVQTGGTGAFTALGQTSRAWYGITVAPNGNVYAVVNSGDIYVQTGGVGTFIALGQTSRLWSDICAAPNGNIYATVLGTGDVFMQTNSGVGTADLQGGTLKLKAGTGKGVGQSRIQLITGQVTGSGTDMQTETVRVVIDETGIMTLPSTTNELITSESTGKAVITKEYLTSVTGSMTALSASYATTASYAPNYLPLTGGVISGNLQVIGTASFAYVTASIVEVGTNTIILSTDYPASRFGGISVIDSGSFGNSSTGSLFWDSLNNKWIYSNPSGSTYDGGMLISGPRNTSGLGNETGMNSDFVAVGQGSDHIRPGSIYNSGSITQVTGSLTVTEGITGSLFGTASHTINQLVTSSLIDSYLGTRIFPTSTTSNGFAVDRNVNGAVGLVIKNSDTSGNGAYSAVTLSPSGSWYDTGVSLIYFNDGYYVTSLRNTGGIFSSVNNNILLLNNKDFSVQTGATISTLSTKFKVSGSGNVYISSGDLEITGSLRVSGSITGSLFGTSSYALNGVSASYSLNSTSASYAVTASFIDGGYY